MNWFPQNQQEKFNRFPAFSFLGYTNKTDSHLPKILFYLYEIMLLYIRNHEIPLPSVFDHDVYRGVLVWYFLQLWFHMNPQIF